MVIAFDPINIVLLEKLIIAHLLTDYIFQPDSWVKDKKANTYKSAKLYLHVIIAGISTYLILAKWCNWWAPALIMIFHYIIDLIKLKVENKHLKNQAQKNKINDKLLRYFLIDQLVHFLVIIGVWLLLIKILKFCGNIFYKF